MKKSNLMPAIVLSAICLISALLLSVINIFTSEKILKDQATNADKTFMEVLDGASNKEQLTINDEYPDAVKEGYKFSNGYVFVMEVKGYKSGLVIMCGIDLDGKIVGVKHTQSNETYGFESQLNSAYIGDTLDTVELIIATGATKKSETSAGYYNAIKAALQAYAVANGQSVDKRTPEQILQDNCNAALGTEEKTFTHLFESWDGFGNAEVYVCDSGTVIVIGESFVGYTNGSTVPVGTHEADVLTAAGAAYEAFASLEKIDLTAFSGIAVSVKSAYKNADGEYMLSLSKKGFEWSEAPMAIEVIISSEGVITSCVTVSHKESGGYGAICGEPEYYEQYIGKTADTYTEVPSITPDNYPDTDLIASATQTYNGYKTAIGDAFSAFAKITAAEGGNE